MMFDVIKIGGSILSNIEDLDLCAQKIAKFSFETGSVPVIVISAFKNYTDQLVSMNKYFSDEPSSFVITVGEQIAAGLFEIALRKYGIKSKAMAGWQVPILISKQYDDGIFVDSAKISYFASQGVVPIITGFQGVDEHGDIQNLGRGGSDLTAIVLAKTFGSACVLLKHSGGICSADPNLIDDCFVWSDVGYDNVLDLAESGSRVIQKEALLMAKMHKVPIRVSNLDFNSYTNINKFNANFWSLLEYKEQLRIVTHKITQKLSEYGFAFHDSYYEIAKGSNVKQNAHNVYSLCKQYL